MFRSFWIFLLVLVFSLGFIFSHECFCEEQPRSGDEVKKDVEKIKDEINLLNLINALNLTKDQMKVILECARNADIFRKKFYLLKLDKLSAIEKVFKEVKRTALDGKTISKELEKKAVEKEHELFKVYRDYHVGINKIEMKIKKVLSEGQRVVLKHYKACLILPKELKDPTRVGQAEDTEGMANFLRVLRKFPDSVVKKFIEKYVSNLEKITGKLSKRKRAREINRIFCIIKEARKMSDIEFELNKKKLLKKLQPKSKLHKLGEDFQKEIAKLIGGIGKIGQFLLDPRVIPLLEYRIKNFNKYVKNRRIDLAKLKESKGCKIGKCGKWEKGRAKDRPKKKKASIEEITKHIGIGKDKREKFRKIVIALQKTVFKFFSIPTKEGKNIFKEIGKIEKMKLSKSAQEEKFISLLNRKIPGHPKKTYLEVVFNASLRAEEKVKKLLSSEEFAKFKRMNVDYLDIQTGYNPFEKKKEEKEE